MATSTVILNCIKRGANSMNTLLQGGGMAMCVEWTKAFKTMSDEDFQAAYERSLQCCTRLPTIADVTRAHNELGTKARYEGDAPDLPGWQSQTSEKGKLWVELVKAGLAGNYERKLEIAAQLRQHNVSESILKPLERASIAVLNGDRQEAMKATASAKLPYPLGQRAIDAAQSMFSYEGSK